MRTLHDCDRGRILVEEAYAQGKMLESRSWYGLLPRKITPSDIDMVIDNNGRILFVEFDSNTAAWDGITRGQRRLYENIVLNGSGKHFAACCRHNVKDRRIDTLHDVLEFQLMYMRGDSLNVSSIYDGSKWRRAVQVMLGIADVEEVLRAKGD